MEQVFSKLCPECPKNELSYENAELGYPDLTGTDKQVNWATTLRLKMIQDFNNYITAHSDNYGLMKYTNAHFWINNCNTPLKILAIFLTDYHHVVKNSMTETVAADMSTEEERLTIKSPKPRKDGVVVIMQPAEDILSVTYMKNNDFIAIAHNHCLTWNLVFKYWERKITEFTGSVDNHVADIGNELLSQGFTVQFNSQEQVRLTATGTFDPECKRWIKYSQNTSLLTVSWKSYDDELFEAAKKITWSQVV